MVLKVSMLMCLLLAGFQDVREQQIHILPVCICVLTGIGGRLYMQDIQLPMLLWGALPGSISFISSRLCGYFIGDGDSLLILSVGIMNGFWFCMRFLGLTFLCVFLYSIVMLGTGKLHRKSQVPCVPFMIIGYIGAWCL